MKIHGAISHAYFFACTYELFNENLCMQLMINFVNNRVARYFDQRAHVQKLANESLHSHQPTSHSHAPAYLRRVQGASPLARLHVVVEHLQQPRVFRAQQLHHVVFFALDCDVGALFHVIAAFEDGVASRSV